MAKKKLGYVELHWECPNCSTINPGGEKICKGCAAPQPADVEFFQASQQQLIEDEERLKKAKAGADIHCAYCGARNPADAKTCSQCKADLSGGTRRTGGRVVGAYQAGAAKQIACPHCGAQNLETNAYCKQCGGSLSARPEPKRQQEVKPAVPARKANPAVFAVIGVILIGLCAAVYFLFLRTTDLTGTVAGVEWERAVVLEAVVPVEYKDWYDQIPEDSEIASCTQEERGESAEPVEGAREVCGTPYNVDQGSGYAEVVQDCIYIIIDDYCTYTVMEWAPVETLTLAGEDYAAAWPDPILAQDERLGEGSENYVIIFEADGETYRFNTENYDLFLEAQPGTTWTLEINSIGGVQSISQ